MSKSKKDILNDLNIKMALCYYLYLGGEINCKQWEANHWENDYILVGMYMTNAEES